MVKYNKRTRETCWSTTAREMSANDLSLKSENTGVLVTDTAALPERLLVPINYQSLSQKDVGLPKTVNLHSHYALMLFGGHYNIVRSRVTLTHLRLCVFAIKPFV